MQKETLITAPKGPDGSRRPPLRSLQSRLGCLVLLCLSCVPAHPESPLILSPLGCCPELLRPGTSVLHLDGVPRSFHTQNSHIEVGVEPGTGWLQPPGDSNIQQGPRDHPFQMPSFKRPRGEGLTQGQRSVHHTRCPPLLGHFLPDSHPQGEPPAPGRTARAALGAESLQSSGRR